MEQIGQLDMFEKNTKEYNALFAKCEAVASYVLDYANSKQLRRGWGHISECWSQADLTAQFMEHKITTKAADLEWARFRVTTLRSMEAEVRAA